MNKPPGKITLLKPPVSYLKGAINASSLVPPVSLAVLAGMAREAGFDTVAIDAVGECPDHLHTLASLPQLSYRGLSLEQIIDRIPQDHHVLGVSCMFSSEWPFVREVIKGIHAQRPDLIIVAGGEHVTALPEFVLEDCPEIDYVILGEGDETLVELIPLLAQGQDCTQLLGIGYRKNGEVVCNGLRPRIRSLDSLPWPAWDLIPIETYLSLRLSHGPYRGRTMPLIASRGCPYKCKFCSNQTMWGKSYISRDPKLVVDEIEHYIKTYEIECIEFYDLTPIVRKAWILDFCDEIIRRNIKVAWQISGGTRTEAIDEEVIKKTKEAGCKYLGFAPESGSEAVLQEIRKRLNLPRMIEIIRMAKANQVDTRTNFVIGFPFDTRWQIIVTLLLQWRLAFMGVVDAPIFKFSPYPGSEYFDHLRSKGIIPRLNDEVFFNLGLDFSLDSANRGYCEKVSSRELTFYQILGMAVFYTISYLTHPRKLISFARNLFSENFSNSVMEQRIIQNLKKRVLKHD